MKQINIIIGLLLLLLVSSATGARYEEETAIPKNGCGINNNHTNYSGTGTKNIDYIDVQFSSPGNVGSYRPGSEAGLIVSVSEAPAKVEFYQMDGAGGTKIGEDSVQPYEQVITNVAAGIYVIKAIAMDSSGVELGSAITELFVGNSLVGIRPILHESYEMVSGQYPFVASHTDVITPFDWWYTKPFTGDFQTLETFFEFYISNAVVNVDTSTNTLVEWIKQNEDIGYSVKHILICREGKLLNWPPETLGPFEEDTRILSQIDVNRLRTLFTNAYDKGILKHKNYKLIQLVEHPTFFSKNSEASAVIKIMDGVCFESHQFNKHWPLHLGWEKDLEATSKAVRWTLSNNLDYVFYYGPWASTNSHGYYDNLEYSDEPVKEWLIRYWAAGMPKHHNLMHYYINNFPHGTGATRPIGPETNSYSTLGINKWMIEQFGRQTPVKEPRGADLVEIPGIKRAEPDNTVVKTKVPEKAFPPIPVYCGGVAGVSSLAAAENSAHYRASGGGLYLHNNGWGSLNKEEQKSVQKIFRDSPAAIELGFEPAAGWAKLLRDSYLKAGIRPDFIAANAFMANNIPTAAGWENYMKALRGAGLPESTLILPTFEYANFAKNIPKLLENRVTCRKDFQAIIRTAGGFVLDTPPGYAFTREEGYRIWLVDAIRWTREHGFEVVWISSPHSFGAAWSADTARFLNYLRGKNAMPTRIVVENYEGNPPEEYLNVVGSDRQESTALGVATRLITVDAVKLLTTGHH